MQKAGGRRESIPEATGAGRQGWWSWAMVMVSTYECRQSRSLAEQGHSLGPGW